MPIGHVNGVTGLKRFFYRNMYGNFARTKKKTGCNIKVAALITRSL